VYQNRVSNEVSVDRAVFTGDFICGPNFHPPGSGFLTTRYYPPPFPLSPHLYLQPQPSPTSSPSSISPLHPPLTPPPSPLCPPWPKGVTTSCKGRRQTPRALLVAPMSLRF
jgi:hypothetical protein